ncbi:MAG TPA: NADH-quinone oxidoreductase subunit N [Cytophagaceae bacterium]|nr:NADH-quinone oxidoreductase subunit N [Cytophagaceae bacterium]
MNAIVLLAVLGVITMLSDVLGFKKSIWYIILIGLLGALFVTALDWYMPGVYTDFIYADKMFFTDTYAVLFSGLILKLVLIWFIISRDQYTSHEFNAADNYALILFATVGALLLTCYMDLSLLFLGIEILSIPMFILAGSRKHDLSSNEASLKYFLMGAFATGIMLFGITLIYGACGSFNLQQIAEYTAQNNGHLPIMFYTGILLIMVGLGFKVSAVPFHFWTPDVYQGAPMFVTAFMATVVKTAAFAGFFRLFVTCFTSINSAWALSLSMIIAATILVANFIAVYQTSVKRMLAYSGIAQAGYILLTLLVLNQESKTALALYLASYSIATLAAFTVLYHVVKTKGNDSFDSFNSLGKTNPFLAFIMTVAMLSLAGIPPTVGFFAKFYLFSAVLRADFNNLWIVSIAVLGSLISVYYYFRVIISMYAKEGETADIKLSLPYKAILVLMVGMIVLLGILPGYILSINNL